MKEKVLAFIPARGGSKGVKNKNIKPLEGKPLIAYTIEAAKETGIFEDIIVSTDSEKIAAIAKEQGAYVPFLRPQELAQDNSTTIDAIKHLIQTMKEEFGKTYDSIIVLQPTSPLRSAKHIKEGYQIYKDKNANFVVSVCECEHSPLWTNTLDEEGRMDKFLSDEVKNKNRQDIPVYYRLNGALYIGKVDEVINNNGFYGKNSFSYIMEKDYSVDIDSELDFKIAEVLMNLLNSKDM